jgi:hypothetical protein
MAIRLGNISPVEFRLGSSVVTKLCLADTRVWPEGFSFGSGLSGSVAEPPYAWALTTSSIDGNVYLVGTASYNGTGFKNGVVKLDSIGNMDTGFNSSMSSYITLARTLTVANTPSGQIYIAGSDNIRRLNTNGTNDTGFTGRANTTITNILVEKTTNKVIASGYDYNNYNCIDRYTTTGLKDNTFVTGSIGTKTGGSDTYIYRTLQDSSNNIYCIGNFTSIQGFNTIGVGKLGSNGAVDGTFTNELTLGASSQSCANLAIAIDNAGAIMVGGSFDRPTNGIAKLDPITGVRDTTFRNNIGTGANNLDFSAASVRSIAVTDDNKYFVGGRFTSFNATSSFGMVKLNTNGTRDTTFNIGSGFADSSGNPAQIEQIMLSGSYVYVVGQFTSYKGTTANRAIRLDVSGNIA